MQLSAYFDRIGYSGPLDRDLATLDALMRAHAAAVPFENLDVQLGRPISLASQAIFDKLVTRRRGGWCYEQNGLFGRVLAELGFEVRRVAAGVLRTERGDRALGNHLTLIVTLDGRPWLADVGFGGSQAQPIPLARGEHRHAPYALALSEENDGYWRFTEWAEPDKPFSFDFRADPADEALLATRCAELQTSAESPFVQNLVVQQRRGERHATLRGRVFSERGADGEHKQLLESADALVATLRDRFGLDVPEAASLWEPICARHAELFGEGAAATSA
jgi:N-hydroxyarylamine O-acetyltransferase